MRQRIFLIKGIILSICLTFSFFSCKNVMTNSYKKVPVEWINELKKYDYNKKQNHIILEKYEELITPDTLTGTKTHESNESGFVNCIQTNLDEDTHPEIIGLFGWDADYPELAIFKQINNSWYLLYRETFHMFYTEPELVIANNFSKNKIFYIRWLHERGSGIYCDAYHFYKLINNKVYPCLAVINEARIMGWGLTLNQNVSSKIVFNSTDSDVIKVHYSYNFFPGSIDDNDSSWDSHEDVSLVKGDNFINYYWDKKSNTYLPEKQDWVDGLSIEKIKCFEEFGNDSLFVKAFKNEINNNLQNGTNDQKYYLKKYMNIVEKGNNKVSESKDKTKIGNTK